MTLIVDEFHTMAGADYEAILSELAKYGASLILATQSLARLESLDREQGRSLRATVFANLDGLFAFHTSAEDARYLVRELGDVVDERDLIELGEHQCYARLSAGRERVPTFSVSLDPPPAGDLRVADALAEASAAHYGRDARAVDGDLQAALANIETSRETYWKDRSKGRGGSAIDPPPAPGEPSPPARGKKVRRKKHPPKDRPASPPRATSPRGGDESASAASPDLIQSALPVDPPTEELAEVVP